MFRKLIHGKLKHMKFKFHMMLQTFTHHFPSIKEKHSKFWKKLQQLCLTEKRLPSTDVCLKAKNLTISQYLNYLKNSIPISQMIFLFCLGFLSQPLTNQRTVGKGGGIPLTPHYHFQPLHRHSDISRAIIAESSPLHIGSSRTRTGYLWFPSASR